MANTHNDRRSIRQCGVIESIGGGRARVRTVRSSACGQCEAKDGCRSHGSRAVAVDVDATRLEGCRVGDRVVLRMPVAMGRNAVAVGFVVPLLAFVAVMVAVHAAGHSDATAALAALATLAVYYVLLYALRTRVERYFKVEAEPEWKSIYTHLKP